MPKALVPRFSLIAVLAASLASAQPVIAQQRQALQTHATAPAGAEPIGRLPASQILQLAISLPLRNQAQLNALLAQIEDPTSPNYHQYLSSAQFREQFGPTVEQYRQVIAFVKSHGFTITHTSRSRQLLNVSGPASAVEQTFQVAMQVYQHTTENRTYFAPSVEPTVEVGLPILGVSGLTDRIRPHPMLKKAAPNGVQSNQTGSGPGGQFVGSDFRAAYYSAGVTNPLTGTGQALALSELGQWNMADVTAYFTAVNQSLNVPIITELLGGTDGTCPGACDDGEEANDIIQIVSMAPGAAVLIVYEDTSNNADVDIFDAFATENISKQMSWSFGIGDGNAVADEQYFAQFHTQGQNFFVASGDEGANLGGGGWPGFSSNITDVGGTDLTTSGAGGAWSGETGWVGSGTGWCNNSNSTAPCYGSPGEAYAGIPTWQVPAIITTAGGNTTYRNVPDVSADANTDSFWCAGGTCQGGLGGTSLAAPRWAGFLALVNEQAAANGDSSVGFLSSLAWSIGQGSSYDTAFHDVTTGCNPSGSTVPAQFASSTGFCAMTGFDMVTGWGTPNGQGTFDTLSPISTTNPYFTLAASPSTVNLTPGGAQQTTTITLTPTNGFTGTIYLCTAILGSPAGLSATLNPTSITNSGTSTLTITAGSNTSSGTQILVVTGNSNSSCTGTQPPQQAAYVTLALPDFSLSVSPTNPPAYPDEPNSIYLNQGGTASATVTVNQQNGFSGAVDLSVNGLPSGVTASFSPTSATTTSDLSLSAGSTAITGTDYLAVTGTSGSITGSLNAPYTILSVSAATGSGGAGTPVSLTSQYNLPAIYQDGVTFGTGMDGAGFGYSSNLLTGNRILNGVQFNFGPPSTNNCGASGQQACVSDAISAAAQTITLPSGQFTTLQLLATGIDGPVLAQAFTVTYTDGTTSQFTQNFSDWCSCSSSTPGPGQQPNEAFSVVMPYRDAANGTEDNRVFNLYAYTFVLNRSKTVQSLTLPAKASSGAVILMAATLTTQSLGTQVNLTNQFNIAGLFNNGVTFEGTGDIDGPPTTDGCTLKDGCTDAYSAQQLGLSTTTSPALTLNGTAFNFGSVNTVNCGPGLTACLSDMIHLAAAPGVTITLPSNQQAPYTTLTMLGTAVNGSQTGTVTINYASGSPTVINQTFSDWCNFTHNSNESIAVGGINRINSDGTLNTGVSCNLYSYTYSLDSTRSVDSVVLTYTGGTSPGEGAFVAAMTLSGSGPSGPGFTLSANPVSASVAAGNSVTSTITVTSGAGYSGTVTLSCNIAPSVSGATAPSCSFGNSSSVTITNGAPATATLTFTTVAPSPMTVQRASATHPAKGQLSRAELAYGLLMMPVSGLVFIGLGFTNAASFRKKKWAAGMILWLLITGLVLLPACGGGNNNGGGGGGCSAAPGIPTGLAASGTSSSGTTLNWSAPTTVPASCTITGYVVYQNGSQIATPTSATYNVTGLNSGQQYSFTVAAADSAGTSAQSSAATVGTGTQATTFTITITATATGGATQSGAPPTVQVTVTQ